MIQELLKQFGLTDKETLVYLAVLEKGKVSATDVSRITKINRTTVYSVAKELVSKGLISEDLGGSTTYLVALPPEEIQSILAIEEKALTSKKETAAQIINELQKITKGTNYSVPKISFIEERRLLEFLKKRTPVWDESVLSRDKTWWGFQDPTFVEKYQSWIDWYWDNDRNEIIIHLLSSESKVEEEMKKKNYTRREIKFWKNSKNFSATTWVCGDFIIMITTSQRPHYLVEINDAVLAHNMRELFKGIWDSVK